MNATSAPSGARPESRWGRDLLILVLLCGALWLPPLVSRSFWHPDEPRFALMTRTMIESGEYVAPTKMGQVYHSKPLLHLWTTALASRLFGGVNESTMRLPSFLAGLGGVLLAWACARSLFGGRVALLTGAMLAADFRYLVQAEWASTDMLLTFFITAALACYVQARRGSRAWYLPMYAMCGLGTLVKGPVGFVLPGLVVCVHLAASRALGEIRRMRLPLGAAIMAVLVGPWLLLFYRAAGAGQTTSLLFVESIQRYLHAWNNQHPWHYYLWRFPVDFLPWSPLLPAAVLFARRRMSRPDAIMLLCWFVSIFLFYSASTGKRGVYILPLHVPAAMACAWFWVQAASGRWPEARAWMNAARWTCAGLFIALGVGLVVAGPRALQAPVDASRIPYATWGLLTAAAGFAIMMVRPDRAMAAVCAGMVVVVAGGSLVAVPIVNDVESRDALVAALEEHVPRDAPFAIVTHSEELAYYARLTPVAELRKGRLLDDWVHTPGTLYMLLDEELLDELGVPGSRAGFDWRVLTTGSLNREPYFVVVKTDAEASR